jgi:hypothetical protein
MKDKRPMIAHARFAASSIAVCLFFAGCGSRNGLTEIGGAASYDGQPIRSGTINFLPADGNSPTAAGVITDGKYALKVAPGKKKVQIEAFKIVGRRHLHPNDSKSPMVDVQEQILPERYNAKSELTCEVTSGVRVYDFALEKFNR